MITEEQRNKLIDWLVEDDKYNFSQGELDELDRRLIEGWFGYKNYSDVGLVNEYYARDEHDPLNLNL